MYRKINRDRVDPAGVDRLAMGWEAERYLKYRFAFGKIRRAYLEGRITRQELLTLRGQVKAGDSRGAMAGLENLLYGGGVKGVR